VRAALEDPDGQFERGPVTLSARGTATDDRPAFVVQDRNYVSARWPGDAYLFGRRFRDLLESSSEGFLSRTAGLPVLRHVLLMRGGQLSGVGVRPPPS
jgi:hypothetical protein